MPGGSQTLNAVLVFGGDATQAIGAVNKLNTNLDKLVGKLSMVNTESAKSQKSFQAFTMLGGIFKSLHGGIQRFVDGIRLTTQGLMSIGRAITFFVALPLGAFFATGSQAALTFEDQMIRVAKTTGLTGDELLFVEDALRRIAKRAPSTHEELGKMAEQAGQLGITAPESIAGFVEWMEILATTTDITGDTVVEKMGKISSAFGWNLNKSIDPAVRLAHVINILENETAASADEILSALYRLAPVASALRITAADATALSAALISMGVSAESVGTQLSNMFIYMTQNSDKVAELAEGTAKYATQQDVLNAINEDAVGVMFDLLQMMTESDNRAVAIAAAFDLVGLRGGRAFVSLANSGQALVDVLSSARIEWSEAESLVKEYNKALESTQSHLKVMKNNINDVAITIGKTFMPAINKAIEILIPGIRRLSEAFSNMSQKQQLMVIGIAALIVLGGPLLFFLSQIAFGFTMIALAGVKMLAGLGGMISMFFKLGSALKMVGLGTWGVVGAFAALAIGVLKILQNMGVNIAGFFSNLGARALAWGENLAANIASGFIAGAVRYIVQAINYVAQLIASFFEGHSPPKEGPLKHINRWGKTLIDTYFKGMREADFSILESISSQMENIFKNFAKIELIGENQQFKLLAKARESLAKLLADFRKTGEISSKLLNNVVKDLGNAGDEIKKLIRLNLEYLQITERLEELERRRKQAQIDYGNAVESIAGSGGDAKSRVRLFRQAMKDRNNELRAIAKEEELLQQQKEAAKEQLDTMKAMIDAMQKQDDIQASMLAAMEKLAKAIGDVGGALDGLGDIGTGGVPIEVPDLETMLEELGLPVIELEARIANGEKILDAFKAGWAGTTLNIDGLSSADAITAYEVYKAGVKIREIYDRVMGTIDRVKKAFGGLSSENESYNKVLEGTEKFVSGVIDWWNDLIGAFQNGWDTVFNPELVGALTDSFEPLRKAVARFAEAWEKVTGQKVVITLVGVLKGLGNVIMWIAGFVGGFLGNIIVALVALISWGVGFFIEGLARIVEAIPGVIEWFNKTKTMLSEGWAEAWQSITSTFDGIRESISNGWDTAVSYIQMFWDDVVEGFGWMSADVIETVTGWGEELHTFITEKVDAIVAFFTETLPNIDEIWAETFTEMLETADEKLIEIRTTIEEKIEAVKTWLNEQTAKFVSIAEDWIEGLKEGAKNKAQALVDAVTSVVQGAIDKAKELLGISSPSDVFIEYGLMVVEGFVKGLDRASTTAQALMATWLVNMLGGMTTFFENMIASWQTYYTMLIDSIIIPFNDAIDTAYGNWAYNLKDKFSTWGSEWMTALGDGMESAGGKIASTLEKVVKSAVEELQPLIDKMKAITQWASNPPSMPNITVPKVDKPTKNKGNTPSVALASGGLALAPVHALIGEVPELVIPLNELPSLFKGVTTAPNPYGNLGTSNIEINIEVGSVGNQKDIEKIADEVLRRLNAKLGMSTAFGVARR